MKCESESNGTLLEHRWRGENDGTSETEKVQWRISKRENSRRKHTSTESEIFGPRRPRERERGEEREKKQERGRRYREDEWRKSRTRGGS